MQKTFVFGDEKSKLKEHIAVPSGQVYCEEKGYGFVPFLRFSDEVVDRFSGTGGWLPRETVTEVVNNWPLIFRCAVSEQGTYEMTIKIPGGENGLSNLNIYTGRRNLVRRDVNIQKQEVFTCQFFVQVCDYIPVVGKPACCDLSVYVSVLGEGACLSEVTITSVQVPTIYLGGDSIVADYEAYVPYNPLTNFGSWGQNLLQYMAGVAISNQAHGGMTTNCFRDDGHWEIVSKNLRHGDIFMFQFGHNDQKRRYLSAHGGYAANLRWYIHQVRKLGAIPIIVTSLSRMPNKDDQGYYDLLEEHAQACLKVGKEWEVPVIDLHQLSFELLCQMDTSKWKGYFNDAAHTNDYGALLMAELVAKEIRRLQVAPLFDHLNDHFQTPWTPNEAFRPIQQILPTDKPEVPVLPTDLPELPYADCWGIRQYNGLKEAMSKGLLDPCLKYFHPFEELPRGQFLFMFFKAFKAPEKRTYQGRFCDIYKYEWDASFVQAALDARLIDETTTPNDRFRPDDGLTGGELVSVIVRALQPVDYREMEMASCEKEASRLGLIWEGYERKGKVNRADCTVALVEMMKLMKQA